MPDFDLTMRAERRADFLAQQKIGRENAAENAARLGREAARLKSLAENPEWKWFRDTYLAPMIQAAHDAALDVTATAIARDNQAHRYDMGRKLVGLLDERFSAALEAVKEALENIPKE
jgi:hypothetical protein